MNSLTMNWTMMSWRLNETASQAKATLTDINKVIRFEEAVAIINNILILKNNKVKIIIKEWGLLKMSLKTHNLLELLVQ